MGRVRTIVDRFCSAGKPQVNGGAPFDARRGKPVGVTPRVENLAYDEGDSLVEKSLCSAERGTVKAPIKVKLTTTSTIERVSRERVNSRGRSKDSDFYVAHQLSIGTKNIVLREISEQLSNSFFSIYGCWN